MNKVLIAIDGSDNSMKAVEFAGKQMSHMNGVQMTLLHVLPYVPAPFWDDGHILSDAEKAERSRVIGRWLETQQLLFDPVFKEAVDRLVALGIPAGQILTRSISDSADTADSIVEEARSGGYGLLVLGRCGHGKITHFPMGSIAERIVKRGTGLTLCIVD